jgi:1-acylglycerone phosphate reductase
MADLEKVGMTTLALDVASSESIKACHDKVQALTGGKLDILINNAGIGYTCPATDMEIPKVQQVFETNVFGLMAMVKTFARLLIATKGLIINISSLSAVTGFVFGSAYAASKGAVVSYSRVLRLEMAPFGVRVMCSLTGTVKSGIQRHHDLPEDSLYLEVKDVFEWRQGYSQTSNPVPASKFAEKLVAASLKPEVSVLWRSWFGRPDWFWFGGSASISWFLNTLGEWAMDSVCFLTFKVGEMSKRLNDKPKQP